MWRGAAPAPSGKVEKLATATTYPEKHPSGNGAAPSGRTEFPEYSLLVRFAAYTGLRAGELGALRVCRLDLLRRRVEVTESVSEVKGHLVFGPTKTYQNRSVPIPVFSVRRLLLPSPARAPMTLSSQLRRVVLSATGTSMLATSSRLSDMRDYPKQCGSTI